MASSRGDGPLVQRRHDVLGLEGAVAAALDVPAGRGAGPGQQVGVVLGHGGDDDVAGGEPQPVGEVVECLGGVAADDRHVVAAAAPGEREGGGPGVLVRAGGHLRLVAGPAVHAGIPGEEFCTRAATGPSAPVDAAASMDR